MKRLLFALIAFSAVFTQQACATMFLPHLNAVRSEIINRQVIVSNAVPLDKPLATALRKALTTIDKTTPTNLVNDTKTLSTVTATLNKTSLSNHFDGLIRSAIINYAGELSGSLNSISNALIATFPSGPHTAANNLITQVFDTISDVLANGNTTLATKALAAITKKLPAIQNLLTKATNAPAPKNGLTATITASNEGTFAYKPIVQSVQAAYVSATHLLNIVSTEIKISGGLHGTVQTRTLGIVVVVPSDGTFTYNTVTDARVSSCYYGVGRVQVGGALLYGEGYEVDDNDADGDSGTITLTFNSTTKLVYGTFHFTANGSNDPNRTATVDGSFSITYLP